MSTDTNGATINPHAESTHDQCIHPADAKGYIRRSRHIWQWRWKNGHITNEVECTACGEVRTNDDEGNFIISKPVSETGTGESNVDKVQPSE